MNRRLRRVSSLRSKLLRTGGFISPGQQSNAGPPTNPFVGEAGAYAHQRAEGMAGSKAGLLRINETGQAFCLSCFFDHFRPFSVYFGKPVLQSDITGFPQRVERMGPLAERPSAADRKKETI